MMFTLATKLSTAVREDTQQRNILLVKERNHPVVEQFGRHQVIPAIIELCKGNLRIRVDKRLLIDSTDTFESAHIERILGSQVTRMFGFYLTLGLLLLFGSFQSGKLFFGQNEPFLSRLGFQSFETFLEGLKVVS